MKGRLGATGRNTRKHTSSIEELDEVTVLNHLDDSAIVHSDQLPLSLPTLSILGTCILLLRSTHQPPIFRSKIHTGFPPPCNDWKETLLSAILHALHASRSGGKGAVQRVIFLIYSASRKLKAKGSFTVIRATCSSAFTSLTSQLAGNWSHLDTGLGYLALVKSSLHTTVRYSDLRVFVH
jgi:hypothetical protein